MAFAPALAAGAGSVAAATGGGAAAAGAGAAGGAGLFGGLGGSLAGGIGSGIGGGLVGGLLGGGGGGGGVPQVSNPVNNAIITTGDKILNLGGILDPISGSTANGGVGVPISRFISGVGSTIASPLGLNNGNSTIPLVIGALAIGGIAFFLLRRK